MKLIFFLIPLLLISIGFNSVYAQTERTQFSDDTLLKINQDGSEIHKWTSTPERILINDVWQDSRYTVTDDYLILETGHGSVKLNKSSCSFDFYPKGIIPGSPLFSDSIVPKMATNGTENFSIISSVNNAICETYGSDYQLVAKKYSAGVGFLEYKYINTGSAFKTQLEVTNLSTVTDKKFGFTQTINLNRDTINYDGTIKKLDNFNGTSFSRTWLESHQSKILDFLNGVTFDFDLGFNNLKSIDVYDTGLNKSKLSFNYLYNNKVILPNETLIIDPTFAYASASNDYSWSAIIGGAGICSATWSADGAGDWVQRGSAGACYGRTFQWDITTITDGSTITNVNVRYDITGVSTPPECKWMSIENQPSAGSGQTRMTDSMDGTTFVANDTNCQTNTNNYVIDLGASADTDLQANLVSNWWGVGISPTPYTYDGTNRYSNFASPELEVEYSLAPPVKPPYAVTTLTSTGTTQTTISLDWTQPILGYGNQYLLGYQINKTTPWGLPTVLVNDTGTSISDYIATGLTLGTNYSFRVSAWTNNTSGHPYNNATGNILNSTTSTYTPPSAPILSALSESDTSVRFSSVNGTTNSFNMFYYGLRCAEDGLGSWVTIVSNSTTPNPRQYSYTGLNPTQSVTCQWRDGSRAGFGDWSNNATETTGLIGIIQTERTAHADKLKDFETWISDNGGLYFGLGVFPMVIMLIGFMATKGTVRIFTLISLSAMGIIHASGYFAYPTWYWTLAILFGIVLILGRQARD